MVEAVDDVADIWGQFLSVLLCPLLLEELTGRREEQVWFVMAACMYIGTMTYIHVPRESCTQNVLKAMGMSIGYPLHCLLY